MEEADPELWPVVANPGTPETPWPWSTLGDEAGEFIRLGAHMGEREIGSFFAQLASYNDVPTLDAGAALRGIVESKLLVLPGGLQTSLADREINPGCCCGLETWREWLSFRDGGAAPWLGHDPASWLEVKRETVRVWSDGAIDGPRRGTFAIVFPRPRFDFELARVEQKLQALLDRAADWARTQNFADVAALCAKLDYAFDISRRHGKPDDE